MNDALGHKIVGGDTYCWNCYGPNARGLEYESEFAHASIVFDSKTQEVYEAIIHDKDNKVKPYRWLNPKTKQSYIDECKEKNVDPFLAWDETKWVDLETEEDFLEKAEAIFTGKSFDERVQIPLDLDRDELYTLMEMAHKQDITLNQMVEQILWNVLNAEKNKGISE